MKIVILWDIAPCSTYMNRRFGRIYHLHFQGRKSAEQETSKNRWLGRINTIIINYTLNEELSCFFLCDTVSTWRLSVILRMFVNCGLKLTHLIEQNMKCHRNKQCRFFHFLRVPERLSRKYFPLF
jgi:hypothetical protein